MSQQLTRFLMLLIIAVLLFGCSTAVVKSVSTAPENSSDTINVEINNMLAKRYFIIGRQLEREEDYNGAIQAYELAWHMDSTSKFLPTYLTNLALSLKQTDKALLYMTLGKPIGSLLDSTIKRMTTIFIANGGYKEALYLYENLDTMTSEDSLLLAGLLEKNRRFTDALIIYKKQLPGNTLSSSLKVANLYLKAEDMDSATTWFKNALTIDSLNSTAKIGLYLSFLKSEDSTISSRGATYLEQYATDSLRDTSKDLIVRTSLASYYSHLNNLPKAIENLLVIYKDHGSVDDYYIARSLGVYYYLNGESEKALPILKKISNINDKDFDINYIIATIYKDKKIVDSSYIDSSITYYKKTIAINIKHSESYRELVVTYLSREDLKESLFWAKQFVDNVPIDLTALALLGSIYNIAGNFESSVVILDSAFSLGLESNALKFEFAMALERTGNKIRAEKLLKEITDNDSTNSQAANYLGYLWAEDGVNLDDSRLLIERALKLSPNNGAYLDSYGWVLYQQGEYSIALKYLLDAEKIIDYDYIVYYHIAFTYLKLGNKKLALEYFIKADSFEVNSDSEIIKNEIDNLRKEPS